VRGGEARVRPSPNRRSRARNLLAAPTLLLTVAGCGDPPDPEASRTQHASIRYELVAEIGGRESDAVFGAIVPGALTSDDHLWVGEYFGGDLLRIDLATRETVERLGGAGAGPGEFYELQRVGLAPDGSVWATDSRSGRVTIFHPSGERTTFRLYDFFFAPPMAMAPPLAVLSDGSAVVLPELPERPRAFPDSLVHYPLLRVARSGEVLDTLFVGPPAPIGGLYLPNVPGVLSITRFLNETPLVSVSPDGTSVGLLHRLEGVGPGVIGTLFVARIGDEHVAIDTSTIPGTPRAGSVSEALRRLNEHDLPPDFRTDLAIDDVRNKPLGIPDWISTVSHFQIASDGSYWVGVQPHSRSSQEWMRLEPGADRWTLVGVPSEKAIFRLIDAREAWLAVILMDDLRVQSIGLFRRTE
jgi:hypothetical protein